MKKLLFLVVLLFIGTTVATAQVKKATTPASTKAAPAPAKATPAPTPKKTVKGPHMEFEKTTVDYGTIEQNADPFREFKFKNTGDAPLVITSAKGSCGCTVPDYPKEPIMPGESNVIKVRYATDRVGPINKQITLTSNEGEEKRVLTIIGNVTKKEEPQNVPAAQPSIFGGGKSDQ